MPTLTTNFGFNKPLINNATDADLWGGYLNDNWDEIDSKLTLFISSESASFAVSATEFNYTYLIDASSAAVTINLPAASNVYNGFTVRFKAIDVTNTITIDGNSTETIDGNETTTIQSANDVLQITCDGSNWQITTATTSFADDAGVIAGTESAKAIAPKFYGDNQDLSSDGYQYLAGGVIHQWGTDSITAPGSTSVSFPVEFPNAVLNIQTTPIQSSAAGSNNNVSLPVDGDETSTTGFTVIGDEIQGTVNLSFYWFAIGH